MDRTEISLLLRATQINHWRWRAEVKRLKRRGKADPFSVHLAEMQLLHQVWRELRKEAGLPGRKPPHAVWRVAMRLADRKCRTFLQEHPDDPD